MESSYLYKEEKPLTTGGHKDPKAIKSQGVSK